MPINKLIFLTFQVMIRFFIAEKRPSWNAGHLHLELGWKPSKKRLLLVKFNFEFIEHSKHCEITLWNLTECKNKNNSISISELYFLHLFRIMPSLWGLKEYSTKYQRDKHSLNFTCPFFSHSSLLRAISSSGSITVVWHDKHIWTYVERYDPTYFIHVYVIRRIENWST